MGIIKKQSIQSTIYTYLGVFVGFLNAAILSPTLFSPEQIGLLGFLISLTAIFANVGSLGIPLITIKMFPKFRSPENKDHGFFFLTSAGSIVGIILGVTFFFIFQNQLISGENTANEYAYFSLVFCVVFAARLIFRNFDSYLRMLYKTVIGIVLEGFLMKLLILGILLFVWINPNIPFDSIFFAYGIGLTLPGVVVLIYLFSQKISFSANQFFQRLGNHKKEMVSVGMFGLIGGLSATIVLEVDRLMISNMLGLDANGVYSVAFFFGVFISIPSRGLKRISAVVISDSLERGDMKNVSSVYRKSCVNQLLIAGYLFLGIWFCIDYVFELMRPEYAAGKYVVLYIGLAQLVDMATGVNAEIINLSKHYRYNTYFAAALVVLVIGLNFLLIPIWEITGAALASFLAIFIINSLRAYFLYKKLNLLPFTRKMAINTLIIGGLLALYSITPSIGNPLIGILISGSILTLVYWTLAYFLKVSEEINTMIDKLLHRFIRRSN